MRIECLYLANFRGFNEFELELHERVTLIAGRNAAGKSAALDGLAVALGAWMSGTTQCRLEDRTIRPDDVRRIRQETKGLPSANPEYPVVVEAVGDVGGRRLGWKRELTHRGGRTTTMHSKGIRQAAREAEARANRDPKAPLPLLAYYGTGRLWVQKRDSKPKGLGSRMQGYAACLEPVSNTKLFQRWMAWRESDRLQRIAAAEEHGADLSAVRSPHLDAVANTAKACLQGCRRLYYSANHKELRVEFEDGRVLPFELLSDGQRSLVVLAADLAWRASQLNPHYGTDAPAQSKGIVLIDEIELHLHPAWQRTVIDNLTSAFPHLQFVMTTHSPQVLATAKPEWIRLLTDAGDGNVSASEPGPTYGKDSNAILEDVMGVPSRPEPMQDQLNALDRALAAGDLNSARQYLQTIRADLGDSDTTVQGLEWELHDAELRRADD